MVEVKLVLKVVVGLVVEMMVVLEVLTEVGGRRLKRALCASGPHGPRLS